MDKRKYIDIVYNYLNNIQGYITYGEISFLVNQILLNKDSNVLNIDDNDIKELSGYLETGDQENEFYNKLVEIGGKNE